MSLPDQSQSVDSALDSLLSPNDSGFYRHFRQRHFWRKGFAFLGVAMVVLGFAVYTFGWRAPGNFPDGASVTVGQGMTLSEVATLLAKQNAIRSPFWFKVWSRLLGGSKGVKAGEYYLSVPISVFELANRLTAGLQNLDPIRVTIPEGLSNTEIAGIFSKSLKKFDRTRFLTLAKKKEGYLFPDTYTFFPNTTEADIVAEMEKNFEKRLLPLQPEIAVFGKPLDAVINMASLIEGEARTTDTRKQIAGILWHRLELGMPLQVDAVFPYILGKNTYEITTDDLKVNSPYNTYTHTGLPPSPINNPSLDAIIAALNPTASRYLYYLSDKDGVMHYAVTHEQHLINRARYLGK